MRDTFPLSVVALALSCFALGLGMGKILARRDLRRATVTESQTKTPVPFTSVRVACIQPGRAVVSNAGIDTRFRFRLQDDSGAREWMKLASGEVMTFDLRDPKVDEVEFDSVEVECHR